MSEILVYANYILDGPTNVFLKMIELVPDEQIHFKPYEESMSVAELVCHILSVMQIHVHAVAEGKGMKEHAQRVPVDINGIKSTENLAKHCMTVRNSIKEILAFISNDHLAQEIRYTQWDNFTTLGSNSLKFFIEEFFHHRGQLSIYLRLLKIQPPFLYEYL